MKTDHVLVARFLHVHEAELARSFLESRGIEAEVLDHHLISINWLYSNAIGGVRLVVHREKLEEAKSILAEKDPHLKAVDEELPVRQPRARSSRKIVLGFLALLICYLLFGG